MYKLLKIEINKCHISQQKSITSRIALSLKLYRLLQSIATGMSESNP
jgi:hypothetical protein